VVGKRNGLQLKVATKKVDPSAFFSSICRSGAISREANRNDPRASSSKHHMGHGLGVSVVSQFEFSGVLTGCRFLLGVMLWAKENEQRAAAQRAEQQRMADFYARQTQRQEDRENAEAREAFLAQQQQLSRNRPLKS
jgi:hypothetical protein